MRKSCGIVLEVLQHFPLIIHSFPAKERNYIGWISINDGCSCYHLIFYKFKFCIYIFF